MVIFRGRQVHLKNEKLKVGDKAPSFRLHDGQLEEKRLEDFEGAKLISVVPSIDTGVCDLQTRRFLSDLSKKTNFHVITVATDLPFALKRWCGDSGNEKAILLSDYFDHQFGLDYGVFMEEVHINSRAVFVLDANNVITYVEYLDEVSKHPDYDAALEAVKKV